MNRRKKSGLVVALMVLLMSCSSENNLIDGYMDNVSYTQNDTIDYYFNVKKSTESQTLRLFDIHGNEIATYFKKASPSEKNTYSAWRNGPSYENNYRFQLKDMPSGIYYFKNSSPFIIKPYKNDRSDVLIVYPSNTVNAYNKYGGKSAYTKDKADLLTFQRPTKLDKYSLPFLKWIKEQPFKVDYICDKDMDDFSLEKYKVIIIPGHSEYWTRKARRNFDEFVNQGGHAIMLSGNTMWYQVRYEQNKMIIYKNYEKDSLVPDALKTISWGDERLNYPVEESIGLTFLHGGYGLKKDDGWNGYKIIHESELLNNTGIELGDTLNIPTAEYDGYELAFNDSTIEFKNHPFYRKKVLGYDLAKGKNKYGILGIFQKTKSSGIIINVGSSNWCKDGFEGNDSEKIKSLTYNFIDLLLTGKEWFKD